jgi:DNA-binding transcriptional LysR family regulator
MLVAVVETGGITAAAQRLGVTQSAVSHLLDKLRAITGDPLFVKSGRGVVATARAERWRPRRANCWLALERFATLGRLRSGAVGDHLHDRRQRLPARRAAAALMQRLRAGGAGPGAAGDPLRGARAGDAAHRHCDLIITPRPPDGADIMQKRLFEDEYRVFYDPACRTAPRTRAAYLAAEHATVVYEPVRALDLDQWMAGQGIAASLRVMVPGFAGLAPFMRGSELLATVPGMLQSHLLSGLASARPPLPCPRMPMFMVWHMRHHQDAAHRWLRGELEAVVAGVVG